MNASTRNGSTNNRTGVINEGKNFGYLGHGGRTLQ